MAQTLASYNKNVTDVRLIITKIGINGGDVQLRELALYGDVSNSVSATPNQSLTESNLDSSSLNIALSGTSFKDGTLDSGKFTLNNVPTGTSIESITYTDGTHCTVNLAYSGRDFDSNFTNATLTIDSTELYNNTSLTSDALAITATDDVESITLSQSGSIVEGAENGVLITATITGGTFSDTLTPANWSIANLPTGVSMSATDVTRVNNTTVTLKLSGNSTADYDTDITNVTVSCTSAEYNDSTGGSALSANTGITLTAKTVGSVTTGAVSSITSSSAIAYGDVTSTGNGVNAERGIVLGQTSNPTITDAKIVATVATTGSYSVGLSGLQRNTTYHVRAYFANEEGTSYGADSTFTTLSEVNLLSAQTISIGSTVAALTYQDGTMYLVPKGSYANKATLDALLVNKVTASCTANASTSFDTNDLAPGKYQVYAVNSSNELSSPSPDITINYPTTVDAKITWDSGTSKFLVNGSSGQSTLTAAINLCTDTGSDGLIIQLGSADTPLPINFTNSTNSTDLSKTAVYTGSVNLSTPSASTWGLRPTATTVTMKNLIVLYDNVSSTKGVSLIKIASGNLVLESGTTLYAHAGVANTKGITLAKDAILTMNGGTVKMDTTAGASDSAKIDGVSNEQGRVTINGGTIINNSPSSYSGNPSAAITQSSWNYTTTTAVYGGTLQGGAAGFYIDASAGDKTYSVLTVAGGSISSTTGSGKAVMLQKGTFVMTGGTVSANTTTNTICAYNDTSLEFSGGTVTNQGTASSSSAIYTQNTATIKVSGSSTRITGGYYGIDTTSSSINALLVEDGIVEAVSSTANSAAVSLRSGTATIRGGTIQATDTSNSNSNYGIYVSDAKLKVEGGTITSASQAPYAAAVYLLSSTSVLQMTGGNVSGPRYGIYDRSTNATSGNRLITGGVISSNSNDSSAAAIYMDSSATGTFEVSGSGTVLRSSSSTTAKLSMNNSSNDNASLKIYSKEFYRNARADVGIAGIDNGSGTKEITASNIANTTVSLPTIAGNYYFNSWHGDSSRTAPYLISTNQSESFGVLTSVYSSVYLKVTTAPNPPTVIATGGSFTDTDTGSSKIGGTITWTEANPTTGITAYKIYWGSDTTTKLASDSNVIYTVNGASSTYQSVSSNTTLPSGAAYFLIYSYNTGGETANCLAVPISDVLPIPGWVSTYPKKGTITSSSAQILVKTDIAGKAYYVLLPDGSSSPTSAQVKAGTNSSGGTALASGYATLSANTESTISLSSLTSATVYNVYVVAENTAAIPLMQASPTKVAVAPDVLAYYKLDGNALDSSGNGKDGTVGGTVSYTTGFSGQAASFAGSGYISLPSGLLINNPNFTFITRFKAASGQYGGIVGYQNSSVNGSPGAYVPIISIRTDGKLYAELWVGKTVPEGGYSLSIISEKAVNDGNWHKVALSAGTQTISLYLDDVLIGSNTGSSTLNYFSSMTYNQLGTVDSAGRASQANGWYPFSGLLDECFIINKGMSSSDIRKLSNSLDLGSTTINEATANDGSITATQTLTLNNGTFAADMSSGVTVNNLPTGLGISVTRNSDTQITISFTGDASSHGSANSISNASVTVAQSKIVSASENVTSGIFKIQFINPYPVPALTAVNSTISEAASNDGTIIASQELTLTNGTFATDMSSGVTVNNLPSGLGISVTRNSDTKITINFTGKATNHGADVNNANVSVVASKINGARNTIQSGTFTFDFNSSTPSISVQNSSLSEAVANDGSILETQVVNLSNGVFAADMSSGVTVNNLPSGLGISTTRNSDTKLTLRFTGNAVAHNHADDLSNLSVTVSVYKISSSTGNVTSGNFAVDFNDPDGAPGLKVGYSVIKEAAANDGSFDFVNII